MAILIDKDTRVLVAGMTGRQGKFHAQQMLDYGTNVVGGITPAKGGEWVLSKPIFDTAKTAKEATDANCVVIFVPPFAAADSILEAIDAEIELIVCITEGIPVADMMTVRARLENSQSRLLGPNCPGLLTPGQSKVGIMPGFIAKPGPVGVVSKSGTLTYEAVFALSEQNMGQTTCVGIGGDPINGTNFIDVLKMFEADPMTEKVVLIGEIGGTDEQNAADFIHKHMTKPVVAFVAGQRAPEGKTMGHAGALVEGGTGTAAEKIEKFESVGVKVAAYPEQIPDLLR
ncbi:MAG: succinate--CoA ligase subunit alpha [Anaerolineales bacterium]|nr:succinate--CoA ligase subunit alpha [Anaerolineales bacterium]